MIAQQLGVIVLVNDISNLKDVMKNLASKGFILSESLDEIGVLTGSVLSSKFNDIAAISGIEVKPDQVDYSLV